MDRLFVFLLTVIGRVLSQPVPGRHLGRRGSFSYDIDPSNPYGVTNWHSTYPACNGREQSPVDIQTDRVRYVRRACPKVNSLNRRVQGTLVNIGHHVEFNPKSHDAVKLTNVPHLPGVFYFFQFHVHYGGTRKRNKIYANRTASTLHPGSEHTINGQRFDGEVHLEFYNSKYRNSSEATQHKDGLVIIATFVNIVPDEKLGDRRFTTFLEQNLPLIYAYKSEFNTDADVSMFLDSSCDLYTYQGSLTTPLCNEVVTWIVLRNHVEVTFKAWTRFVFVESHDGYNELYGNYRPTMPVYVRTIETNFLQPDMPKPRPGTPKPVHQSRFRVPHSKVKAKSLSAGFLADLNPGPFQRRAGSQLLNTRKGSYRYGILQKGRSTDPQLYRTRAGSRHFDARGRSYQSDFHQSGWSTKRRRKVSKSVQPFQTRDRSQRRSQRRMVYPKYIPQKTKRIGSRGQFKNRQISDIPKFQTKTRQFSFTKGTSKAVSPRTQTSFSKIRADTPYRTNPARRGKPFGPFMSTHDKLYHDDVISPSYMLFDSIATMADHYSPQYLA